MDAKAKVMPGHILLPAPKGMYSKLFPSKSMELSSNLSGIKISASYQYWESLPIPHTFTMILVLIGISYPSMMVSLVLSLGSAAKEQEDVALNVSLITNFM